MTPTEYTIAELPKGLTDGPQWLSDKRRQQRLNFNDTPLPRRGLHLWRYTDPAKFLPHSVFVAPTAASATLTQVAEDLFALLEQQHLSAVAIDQCGQTIDIRTSDELTRADVVILPLDEAARSHAALVEPHLYQLIHSESGKFEALNGALWRGGIFVHVPDNKTVALPIHLVRDGGPAVSHVFPRLLIVAGKNAEVTIIDEYIGGPADSSSGMATSHGAVELFAGASSRVRYLCLQRQSGGMNSYLTYRARIGNDAQIVTIPLALGANLSKQNFGVILNGKGSDSRMFGLAFGSQYQQFDNHTLHHHTAGPTTSNIDFKVVLADKATSAYTGLIRIDDSAKGCQAYQENRNLLLNPGTRAESIPELEILNDDVSCSHGATVGPIDPMQVFYLQSRGIDYDTAERLIVAGFLEKTLQIVPVDLRERVSSLIQTRLEAM
jgi:Fe-S cluster assembly protein SufD